MTVRCKFKCDSVTGYEGGQEDIKMSAICGDVGENKSFAKYTPCGTLTFSCTNPDVKGTIKPGQVFYLDIVPVEA